MTFILIVLAIVAVLALAQLIFDRRCPSCRKGVSRSAAVCPYCHRMMP